jgi:hypothetical protein
MPIFHTPRPGECIRLRIRVFVGVVVLLVAVSVAAQNSPLRLKQDRDGAPAQTLSMPEFASLGDPLFNLVLKDKANLVKLSDVEHAIQPDPSKRRLFVVSERIVSDAKTSSRRAVLTFLGESGGEPLQGNIMLSFSFGPDGPSEVSDFEAWGWDNHRGRYNYYKLDRTGTPDAQPTWKFRASSDRADLLRPAERAGTCLACHVNGAPIMKELFLPWNNWHSSRFTAEYLIAGSGHPNLWPVASTPRFTTSLDIADRLETDFIIPAVKRFNTARLNAALKRRDDTGDRLLSPDGRLTVVEGRRLLQPLFDITEVNLISSRDKSGRHPFASPTEFVPNLSIRIPDNFFLNTHLIAGGGTPDYIGLQLPVAAQFRQFATLTQQENKDLLDKFEVRLNNVRGDTNFAWFGPEPSLIDNDMADQLLRTGIVTPHFLAAVLAVDLENPVFSEKRTALLKYVPNQFEFKPLPSGTDPNSLPRDPEQDFLTQAVIAAIDQDNPPGHSPADEFRTLLKSADARHELSNRVQEYVAQVEQRLSGDRRQAELERLFRVLLDRREAMLRHPVLRNLDETNGQLLLPLPASSFGGGRQAVGHENNR